MTDSASSEEPVTPEMVANSAAAKVPAMDIGRTASSGDEPIRCKWKDCKHLAASPDALYDHLCNTHVGRKSTNNLCLTCGWDACGVKCVKRDHITSHLRGKSLFYPNLRSVPISVPKEVMRSLGPRAFLALSIARDLDLVCPSRMPRR